MQFALEAHKAWIDNNYSRFFKLAYKATYLTACLLHKYFNKMRILALNRMNTCYRDGAPGKGYPLEDLVRVLGFEDEGDAADFCTYHGLPLSEDGRSVPMHAKSLVKPEEAYKPHRSFRVVESKTSLALPEIVRGRTEGALPFPPEGEISMQVTGIAQSAVGVSSTQINYVPTSIPAAASASPHVGSPVIPTVKLPPLPATTDFGKKDQGLSSSGGKINVTPPRIITKRATTGDQSPSPLTVSTPTPTLPMSRPQSPSIDIMSLPSTPSALSPSPSMVFLPPKSPTDIPSLTAQIPLTLSSGTIPPLLPSFPSSSPALPQATPPPTPTKFNIPAPFSIPEPIKRHQQQDILEPPALPIFDQHPIDLEPSFTLPPTKPSSPALAPAPASPLLYAPPSPARPTLEPIIQEPVDKSLPEYTEREMELARATFYKWLDVTTKAKAERLIREEQEAREARRRAQFEAALKFPVVERRRTDKRVLSHVGPASALLGRTKLNLYPVV